LYREQHATRLADVAWVEIVFTFRVLSNMTGLQCQGNVADLVKIAYCQFTMKYNTIFSYFSFSPDEFRIMCFKASTPFGAKHRYRFFGVAGRLIKYSFNHRFFSAIQVS
jgi:hypothetical protein